MSDEINRACDWCGVDLAPDAAPSKVTCSDAHRALRWRWLNMVPRSGGRGPQEPPSGSPLLAAAARLAEAVRADAGPSLARANGSPRKRKPSGLQVSWRRAVEAVAAEIAEFGAPDALDREAAEEILRPALSDRQRERLEARES